MATINEIRVFLHRKPLSQKVYAPAQPLQLLLETLPADPHVILHPIIASLCAQHADRPVPADPYHSAIIRCVGHAQTLMYFRATLASSAPMFAEYKQDPSAFLCSSALHFKPLLWVRLTGGIICCGQASMKRCYTSYWLKGRLPSMSIEALMLVPQACQTARTATDWAASICRLWRQKRYQEPAWGLRHTRCNTSYMICKQLLFWATYALQVMKG